jgi:hypothetical protein
MSFGVVFYVGHHLTWIRCFTTTSAAAAAVEVVVDSQ